jgi:hypothetical protein
MRRRLTAMGLRKTEFRRAVAILAPAMGSEEFDALWHDYRQFKGRLARPQHRKGK